MALADTVHMTASKVNGTICEIRDVLFPNEHDDTHENSTGMHSIDSPLDKLCKRHTARAVFFPSYTPDKHVCVAIETPREIHNAVLAAHSQTI